jgi:hypothetical protein
MTDRVDDVGDQGGEQVADLVERQRDEILNG